MVDETSNGNVEYLALSAKFFFTPENLMPTSRLIALLELTHWRTHIEAYLATFF
jgi:hypothetical protein